MNAKTIGILSLLLVLWGFLAIVAPDSFLTGKNIENVMRRTSMFGILGIGVAFVIITSGIDLSIGSLVCLVACLLALFLEVSYEPFGVQQVSQVEAAARTIVVEGRSPLKAGDVVRYYGGRRARTAVAKVVSVGEQPTKRGPQGTRVVIDQALTRNDDEGQLAKMFAIRSVNHPDSRGTNEAQPRITIEGEIESITDRDRLQLVKAGGGLKELEVTDVAISDGATTISVNDTVDNVTTEWYAIPIERRQRFSVPVAVAFVLGISLMLGLIHGLLITKLRLQPFVVTLCGLLIYRGYSRWVVEDRPMGFGDEFDSSLRQLGIGELPIWESAGGTDSFGIPIPFFVLIIVAVLAATFLNKTIWGRYMLALGRNEDAARYSGVNTNRMTLLAYVICAVLAALGGILFALDSNSAAPSTFGNFYELYAIAAAVLGGCSLRGGEGGILGVVIGTAVMQTLNNLIVLLKINDSLEFAIIGAVILMGVIADEVVKRFAARRRAAKNA